MAISEDATGKHPALRIELKYFEGEPAIKHVARVSKPGRRVYSGSQGAADDPQRPWHHHRLDARAACFRMPKRARRTSAAKCWRRCSDEPHRQSAGGDPERGHRRHRRTACSRVKGPKGTLTLGLSRRRSATRSKTARSRSSRPTTPSRRAAFWGMQRTLVSNLVEGVTEGFTKMLEITGVGYRAAGAGPASSSCSSATATMSISTCPKASRSRRPTRPRSRSVGHRQAGGRPVRRRNPPLAQARALQGQGHQVSRRVHLPQGREEEVRWPSFPSSSAAAAACAPRSRRRAGGRPRLSVHRTGRHIYAQIIDDARGPHRRRRLDAGRARQRRERRCRRRRSARTIAEAAKKAGVTTVVFDRGGFLFHGRVKALADAAREGGLEF